MCLITDQQEPKFALQDITVYKYGNRQNDDTFRTPYQYFAYIKDEKVSEKFSFMRPQDWWMTSCERMEEVLTKRFGKILGAGITHRQERRTELKLRCVARGFHACTTLEEADIRCSGNEVVGRFIIPAGASYFEFAGETISNSIIFKHFI